MAMVDGAAADSGVAAVVVVVCAESLSDDDGDRAVAGGCNGATPLSLVGECGCMDAEEEDAPDDGGGLDELVSLPDPAGSVAVPVSSTGGVAAATGGGGSAATATGTAAFVVRPPVASLCTAVVSMSSASSLVSVITSMALHCAADGVGALATLSARSAPRVCG